MIKHCKHCQSQFEITQDDLAFYDKISPVFNGKKYQIPAPTLCPDCRQQRRLSFRNERKLYKRKCDLTGKEIISIYSPDKPYKVYDQKQWWSDKWNPLDYGIDFDFNRGFFEQFKELLNSVSIVNLIGANNENSEYINLTADSKNCYLVFESSNNEDCYYGYWLQKCNKCCDTSFSHECANCYEIQDCYNCYTLMYSNNCVNCRDSFLLNNCQSCRNCFGCVNIINKEYYIFNKPYSKEKYDELLRKLKNNFRENFDEIRKEFNLLNKNAIKKYAQINQIENSAGDYMKNVKNCIECFHAYDAEDCKYGEHVWRNAKNLMDVSTVGRDANLVYEAINTGISVSNDLFCMVCWSSSNMIYCSNCFNSNNCFGCIGLRNKSYCILNKQYTKEQYEELVPRIIEHMMKIPYPGNKEGENPNSRLGQNGGLINEGDNMDCHLQDGGYEWGEFFPSLTKNTIIFDGGYEWGEFFPSSISPFGYNETVAMEYFPMTREEVLCSRDALQCVSTINCDGRDAINRVSTGDSIPLNKGELKGVRNPQTQNPPTPLVKGGLEGGTLAKGDSGEDSLAKGNLGVETLQCNVSTTGLSSLIHGPIFNWSEYESPFPKVDKIITKELMSKLPDNIKDVPDDILNWALTCEVSNKPYRIIAQELEFYRKHNIPIPRRHPDQRHLDRMKLRNPRKLYDRKCDKCGKDIKTTYGLERKEIVYCEECYNREIY